MIDSLKNRNINWTLVFAGVVAVSTLLYTILTYNTLRELKRANDLQREEQTFTLRPYVAVEDIVVSFDRAGEPDEKWDFRIIVLNKGSLPATNVRVYARLDQLKDVRIEKAPDELQPYSLSPLGGLIAVPFATTKREALNHLETRGVCFLHIAIWYAGRNDQKYESNHVFSLDYRAGERLEWKPVSAQMK